MVELAIKKCGHGMGGMAVSALCLFAWQTPAFAHVGHIGELAGHGHLVGIALTGAAIALAGWAVKVGADQSNSDASGEESATELQGDGSQTETGDEVHA